MTNTFYLSCTRERVGSNEGFWAKNGKGYTTDLRKAHVYSLDEAQKAWDKGREIDRPLCAERVNSYAIYKVDYQYIPNKTTIDNSISYVAFFRNEWDGNDVYWVSDMGMKTTNFSRAEIFPKSHIKELSDFICIPFKVANEQKRPTFNFNLINHMEMITAVGLKTPERLTLQL